MVLLGADRAVQRRGRRRRLSAAVDRGAGALRLRHLRPVHRRAELAERRRRQRHPRPRHGRLLCRLRRRPRRRLVSCSASSTSPRPQAPLVGIVFTALSILPVGMTRLRQPPPPEGASVALRRAWRISPVGVAGMLAVGGLSMMIAGFAPIHATAKGYSASRRWRRCCSPCRSARCCFQIPLGWISDRTDRRYVLIAASAARGRCGHRGEPLRRQHAGRAACDLRRVERRVGIDLFAVQRARQRPRRQGRPGGAVEHDAVCLVAVGLHRAGRSARC